MISYDKLDRQELEKQIGLLEERYQQYKAMDYHLKMTRGVPCKEQMDLSNDLATCLKPDEMKDETGLDCRNYGVLDGIPEAKALFAALLGIQAKNVFIGANSSLNMMYDTVSRAMHFGVPGSVRPWGKEENLSFLCPVPGYDRHFAVTGEFGIRMISVPMTPAGPDMDRVEALAAADASIKGIWCVPVYSNPDGITYSEETCRRLASMRTAAPDFRILWDNAYIVHSLDMENPEQVPDMLALCEEYGNKNRVVEFASTSKITWAGAGVACMAASDENIAYFKAHISLQTIGSDKINQLRHVRFLKDKQGILEMMKMHAAILRPKFEKVLAILESELGESGIAQWNKPKGGYFISLFVAPGTAKKVVELCKNCGVEVTPAGATFPYGNDPLDSNIRIAPTFPPLKELTPAIEILCVSVKLAAASQALKSI